MKLMDRKLNGLKSEKCDQLNARKRHTQTIESFANLAF
jgi:hypothetical protein